MLASESPLEVIHGFDQAPAGRKGRTVSAADKDVVVHVPNGGLTRVGVVEHIIWFATTVEVGCCHQFPASRKRWAVRAADENVVVEIPDRCLAGSGFIKHIIRLATTVEVGCTHQFPATGKSRPISAAEECWSR